MTTTMTTTTMTSGAGDKEDAPKKKSTSTTGSYDRVVSKAFKFKDGSTLRGAGKKKKSGKKDKKDKKDKDGGDGDTYAKQFPYEAARQAQGRGRTVSFGTNYRAAPDTLHGYNSSWKDKKTNEMSYEERLDLRAATKADKFCK
jgi:hypothetical protein